MARSRWLKLAWTMLATLLAQRGSAQTGGQGEVAMQGYYLGGQAPLSDTSGLSLHFQQFVPHLGMLSGSFENYGSQGRWRQGDDFLQIRGLAWQGYRWNVTGGDFRVSTILTTNPFTNLFYPELNLRGVETEASRGNVKLAVFYGVQTLLSGPRIPFRMQIGEHILGGTVRYRLSERLELGVRLLRMTTDPNQPDNFLFPTNRRFRSVNSAALQAFYRPFRFVRVFAETSVSSGDLVDQATGARSNPLSSFVGAAFESSPLTIRVNYADQGALYLPIAGYFAGDRRGPFGELRLRPFRRLELFASASKYLNNRERDERVPTFDSLSYSAGLSLQLPSKFTLSAQLSTIRFQSIQASSTTRSDNQLWSTTLNRPVGKHNLRFTYREMKLDTNSRPERQVSREVEDIVQFRNILIGGSARFDTALGDQHRSTWFGRGTLQLRLHRLTAYSYVDLGRDLVNQSVFATNSVNSTIFGLTTPVSGGWSLQAEAFRNTLTTALNPGNIFILQGQGVAVPTTLAGLNQWSVFFRLTKPFHWGASLAAEGLDRYTTEHIPITGTVAGLVYETTIRGRIPVPGIPVGVDGSRVALTNAAGSYDLLAVPEGQHEIALRVSELPTDFEPGNEPSRTVTINTRRMTRLDFEVFRLGEICGKVHSPADVALDNLVIRLLPTARYTTPEPSGSFCFYNVRGGTYDVALEVATLPALTTLTGPSLLSLKLDTRKNGQPLEFRLEKLDETKPVRRKILDNTL